MPGEESVQFGVDQGQGESYSVAMGTLEEIATLESDVIELKPGDAVLISVPGAGSTRLLAEVRGDFEKALPGVHVIFLGGGSHFERVLRLPETE